MSLGARLRRWWTEHPWGRASDWSAVLVVSCALAASAGSLTNGFAYDDVAIASLNPRTEHLRWPWVYLREPYWGPPNGEGLYRPLAIFGYAVQRALGHGIAEPFHILNVTGYVAVSLLVLALARRVVRPGVALAAALLWAAHPVHVEVVANVVGQAELWVAGASLAGVLVLWRALDRGALTAREIAALVGVFAVALASKENGVVVPGLLAATWVTHPARGRMDAALRARLWLLARVLGYVLALYLAARYAVLGSLKGDLPHPNLVGLSRGARLWAALGFLVTDARLLFGLGELYADYSAPFLLVHRTPDAWHLVAAGVVLCWVGMAWWSWRRGRSLVPALWVPIAMAPVANVLFPTGILVAERALFLPSIGWVLGWAIAVDLLGRAVAAQLRPSVRLAIVGAAGVILLAAIQKSAARQHDWADSPAVVAAGIVSAPNNPRWQLFLGNHFLRAREWERAEVHLRLADSLGLGDPRPQVGLARAMEVQGRYVEAVGLYDRVLRAPGQDVSLRAHLGRIVALIELGRYAEARREAVHARAGGVDPVPMTILALLADSLTQAGRPTATPPGLYIMDSWALVRRDASGTARVIGAGRRPSTAVDP